MSMKNLAILPVAALFTFLGAVSLSAAPITFNTALPVAEGEGVFRVQARLIRSTDDPGPLGRELTVGVFPIVLAYGVTEKLAFFGIVPILDKKMEIKSMGATREAGGLSPGPSSLAQAPGTIPSERC